MSVMVNKKPQINHPSPFPDFHRLNSDHVYYLLGDNPEIGKYKKGCGLNNVLCSFGHDEYMYQTLKRNQLFISTKGGLIGVPINKNTQAYVANYLNKEF